jgi:hypothetical protein
VRRWLTPTELGEQLARRNQRVAALSPKRRREYIVRLVQRVERLEEARFLRRTGRNILISWRAIESLLPPDVATVDLLDANLSALNQEHRALKARVGGHGASLREHRERIILLEEKEAARREFEAKIQAIESRSRAAG